MKVIGAGFGRTGTTSMKAALEHLGYGPTYHMFEVIAQPHRASRWADILDGNTPDWEGIFDGYESTVDWPGCTHWRELAEYYPDAKVLLTVRDSQKWYESVYNSIYQVAVRESESPDPELAELLPTIRRMIWDAPGTFDGRFEDRDFAISVYERHNAAVIDGVPSDRLLVYRVGDGWEPLCDFLDVDVPDEDFPHVNDSASLADIVAKVRADGRVPDPFAVNT
ncbi:sulfotransferase family protein [Allosaccharopolyspora coralli]|uniref:Sulfotransferase family protein n=1 Tax=Allosaccharopolyspora coralli TaxID=2665642 RepID=A0A5Q3Q637_9PSEU|nr:sulfotransferase family protein [Allosaccharopolyspora coralli]QGK70091.1 sulfotransferase family protein [Allosaccharopolyspora coralli]